MSPQNQPKQTKAERTAAAREQARLIREAEQKRRQRNAWLIRGGVVVVAVAIIAIIAVVVVNGLKAGAPISASGPVPANTNAYGGVVVGKNGAVQAPVASASAVDRGTLPPAPTVPPTAVSDLSGFGIAASGAGKPVQVVVYLDFICPVCKAFETTNASVLKDLADAGKITYEYRPAGLLDNHSTTNYSSRSAAAAACVANSAPDKYLDFAAKLYANQPPENGAGLTNDVLKQYAKDLGANIDSCVDDKTYRPLAAYMTQQAAVHGISGTPSIFVDGQQFQWKTPDLSDFQPFVQGIIDAKAKPAGS
ncbi:DsbA family protein [Psychromicrobium xiongbiense]|uniref:DsbA family protein n=1 Tax=Psychromicrobium xiongbiense TaxID=3051184 RepID=UPI002557B01B|nr:thioredoxin domain-containing protein [Psychromicrobium sp. YIM S02556]